MSQLALEIRQPEPAKSLVQSNPVREGKKLQSAVRCIICSSPKLPYILDVNKEPLVLRCITCGHKSWYSVANGT